MKLLKNLVMTLLLTGASLAAATPEAVPVTTLTNSILENKALFLRILASYDNGNDIRYQNEELTVTLKPNGAAITLSLLASIPCLLFGSALLTLIADQHYGYYHNDGHFIICAAGPMLLCGLIVMFNLIKVAATNPADCRYVIINTQGITAYTRIGLFTAPRTPHHIAWRDLLSVAVHPISADIMLTGIAQPNVVIETSIFNNMAYATLLKTCLTAQEFRLGELP